MSPMVEDASTSSPVPPISEIMETPINQKVVVTEPLAAGVGPDQPGKWDNWIGRLGASYYKSQLTGPQWGFLSTAESTHQFHDSNWFAHGGVAGVAYDGHTPLGYSVGVSHLARLVGNKVDDPWVLALAYDGFYDNHFLGITNNGVYLDQMRGMLGYAVCSRLDVGVWAAGGITRGTVNLPTTPFTSAGPYSVYAGTRVAGYAAWNFFQTGIFNITSVGWQDNKTGNFFMQSDAYLPLTGAINAFVGGGYGNSYGGSSNFNCGLEFTWGRTCVARYLARTYYGKQLPKVGMMPSDTMACGTYCTEIDPCCVRYRGGWANDTYRSAFRVMSPSQFAGQINLKQLDPGVPAATSQGNPVVVPNPGTSGTGTTGGGTTYCPPNTTRIQGRPVRQSNLSEYLAEVGKTPATLDK